MIPVVAPDALPWPTCGLCCKPVEMMRTIYNPERMVTEVHVRCHGATEMVVLEDFLLLDRRLGPGVAFMQAQPLTSARAGLTAPTSNEAP